MYYTATVRQRRPRRPLRAFSVLTLKLGVTALVGLGGYLFIWDVAAPYVVNSVVGEQTASN